MHPPPHGPDRLGRQALVPPVNRRAPTFADLCVQFAAGLRSDNTRRAYLADLRRFAQWCDERGLDPLTVTSAQLAAFRRSAEDDGASPATVSRRLATLSSFYGWAGAGVLSTESPMDGVDRPEPETAASPPALDPTQAAALVAAGARLNPKTALLVNLLLLDGLKLAEALSADASELNRDATSLEVSRRRGTAVVALQPATTAAATAYLVGRRSGPLLRSDSPTAEAGRLSRFGADYLLKQAGSEAALDDPVSANMLRRSYVVLAHGRGASLESIRDRLGHDDVRTTRRHLGSG